MKPRRIFILGGSRSGKSTFAQKLAHEFGKDVLFVATAEAGDEEMARRIATHRKNRPKGWRTLEATTKIGKQIEENAGDAEVIIVDCLTLLVSNLLMPLGQNADSQTASRVVRAELNGLLKCLDRVDATFIIVSNEVGLGLVPPYPLGRLYRDLLGEVNQAMARQADEVYFMTAGIPMRAK